MSHNISPCADCRERRMGCHAGCHEYEEYAEMRTYENEAERRESAVNGYIKDAARNMRGRVR